MAEMRAAFGMTQDQMNVLADKINYLGNNTAASAKDILEITQRIGPLGSVAGAASGSIAAMGATLRGMGVQNEIAATGIKNLLLSLTAG
ncbi:phage tail tape measure protein, partial [Escherichia coli]